HRREPLRRLVEQQEPGAGHQGPGDRQHLLLAAREAPAAPTGELSQLREEREDALERPGTARLLTDLQVLDHREVAEDAPVLGHEADAGTDRKSTRLNSSHVAISYAVFCLKKKKKKNNNR